MRYNVGMRPDIVNLRQFYSSRLGRRVKLLLRQAVLDHWVMTGDETLLGIGYAAPLLRVLERQGARSVALMPRETGAIYWPVHGANRSVLGDALRPPFGANTLQRIVVLHGFEYETRPDELLAIAWELLAPGGRLLLVVPNRRGLWSGIGRTPFATGTPYALSQLRELLAAAQFTLRDSSAALFAPPSAHPLWQRVSAVMEWLGRTLCPVFGGVLIVDAEKQIYAGVMQPVTAKRPVQWAAKGIPA
ncbi:MAG: class I SAM-dependent methyltransferase [Rickettsiales bacterium]